MQFIIAEEEIPPGYLCGGCTTFCVVGCLIPIVYNSASQYSSNLTGIWYGKLPD